MIRTYREKDKSAVRNLYRDLDHLNPTFSKLEDSHFHKFVYEDEESEGEIRGIVILHVPYLTGEIFNLWVDEEYRGEGIGTELVDFALQFCKKRDLGGLRVHTDPENKEAIEFYKKRGFKYAGKVKNYNVDGETSVFFYRSIKEDEN